MSTIPSRPQWKPFPTDVAKTQTLADPISMELEVADATAALAELRTTVRESEYPLTDEAFGQRRFRICDPSRLWATSGSNSLDDAASS